MSKKNTIEDFGIGDKVNVDPIKDDLFDNFTGHIIGKRGEFFVVEDQDGDAWDCLPEQISHNTDDIH